MTEEDYIKATEFAQGVVDSTPKANLEDHWVQFSDTIDINIWHDYSPIYATAYPIRTDEDGNRYTDTQVYCTLNVDEG